MVRAGHRAGLLDGDAFMPVHPVQQYILFPLILFILQALFQIPLTALSKLLLGQ